jgi:hypothetical protein
VGEGPAFTIERGGRTWVLRPDADRPGLAGDPGSMLALAGLAARGRSDPRALHGATLVQCQRHFERIEATYRPPDWGELTVRAAWFPGGEDCLDLEVEVSARSVGLLRAVEVLTAFELGPAATARPGRVVRPRDRHCAGLSYDGREEALDELTTAPIPTPGTPLTSWLTRERVADPAQAMVLMGRPEDVSRVIQHRDGPGALALFGHDLERGVVLRGRVRAIWAPPLLAPSELAEFAEQRFGSYCQEPPPLTT